MSRVGYLIFTSFLALSAVVFSLFQHAPRLMWNESASVPVGLYTLHPASPLKVGDLVAERPATNLARYMAVRRYLPLGVPLLKFIAAIPDQTVCRQGPVITIDGLAVATARASDHANRPLPGWQGCHRLNAGEIFLLNPARPDSFDGRYFGMVPRESVMAKAEALWTESE
ncbi:MAG TPA: S26 family signal peptidase [Rhizomicrobium sp.]|nr:S26 family signal peptidase [Rhizomicrobium sp.]